MIVGGKTPSRIANRQTIISVTPAAAIKRNAMARLDELLVQLVESVTAAGGQVHWANDGEEANAILAGIVKAHGADEVVKVKSLASDEIEMNEAIAAEGITAHETDLA